MQNNSQWRSPTNTTDKNPFRGVSRVASMANLQESWSYPQDRPATSHSSSSYSLTIMNLTAEPEHDESRTPTPTNTSFLPFSVSSYEEKSSPPTSPKNPWAKLISARRISPPHSPGSSSNSQSPDSVSRSDTPIAPQPLRPFPRDEIPFLSPFSPYPTVSQNSGSLNPFIDDGDRLQVQFISSELIQKEHRRILNLVQRQSWSAPTKKMVYQWVLQNPKTSLLLWMADDVQAWPKAFIMGLEDNLLPYTEDQLEGKAINAQYVVELQWRVAIKQLPREGRHTEFATHETVPLHEVGDFRTKISQPNSHTTKRIDIVQWCDSSTPEVYVRKRLDVKAKPDKDAILLRIREYHTLSHPNIAKIVASYARGQTVAFLTVRTETNLAGYLETFASPSEASQLFSWILDISSALAYIHAAGLTHRSIRPHKILVDPMNGRITLSPFGIATPARSAGSALFSPFSSDPTYIYAAPESVGPRNRDALSSNSNSSSSIAAHAAPSDVWSLGCVMLEMATAARGTQVEKLHSYCAAESHDPSYHANQRRALSWAELIRQQVPSGGSGGSGRGGTRSARRERSAAGVASVLVAVQNMLAEKPEERPTMRQVVAFLEPGKTDRGRRVGGLRSLGVDVGAELARGGGLIGGSGVWGELESLNGYYTR
jgi:serine/threonine protein kinase